MVLPIDNNAPLFDDEGHVIVEEISNLLGFKGQLRVVEINSGVSERTLKRPKQTAKTVQALSPMIRLTNLVWKLFEGDKAKISEFIHTPREEWNGFTPAQFLMIGKYQGVIGFLERWNSGAEGLGG